MTARSTFESSVKTAGVAQTVTLQMAETTKQETVNASGCNVGYNLQTGNNVNFVNAIKNANIAKINSATLAEHNKQVAINNARDTLRATGDLGPI